MIQDPEDRGGLLTSLHALFATAEGDRGRADEWIRKTVTEAKGYLHFHHSAYIVGSAYVYDVDVLDSAPAASMMVWNTPTCTSD